MTPEQRERVAVLDLAATLLTRAAEILEAEDLRGAAQDCRMVARWRRDAARTIRKSAREDARLPPALPDAP